MRMVVKGKYRRLSKENTFLFSLAVYVAGTLLATLVWNVLNYLNFIADPYGSQVADALVVSTLVSAMLLCCAWVWVIVRIHKTSPSSSRSISGISTPLPRTPAALLYFLLPKHHRENFLGDMEHEYRKAVERIGTLWAKLWFSKEVLSEVGPVLWPRLRRLAGLVTFLEVVRRWIGS